MNDRIKFPSLGLGTSLCKENQLYEAVKFAVKECGYRAIDSAFIYQNEKELGRAFKDLFDEGVVKREDLFITSKLWPTFFRSDLISKALDVTLKNLQLDYLDLYLIHWPQALKEDGELFPKDENGKPLLSDVDYLDVWKELIKLKETGKIKNIGVSNFNIKFLDRLIKETGITPAVNQVECHPYLPQKELLEFQKKHNIILCSYCPLGTPGRQLEEEIKRVILMDDPIINQIAKKYNKTVAQILIRFHIDRGESTIPKSASFKRLKENIDVFDFNLTKEDLKTLENLNINHRYIDLKDHKNDPYYPFNEN